MWPLTASAQRVDPNACQSSLAAVLDGDVDAAVAALQPPAEDLAHLKGNMRTAARYFMMYFQNHAPRLERTLPSASIETGAVGLQIWSFGDRIALIFGCHVYRSAADGRFYFIFEARPTVQAVLSKIREAISK
jgi:hypothetical protein